MRGKHIFQYNAGNGLAGNFYAGKVIAGNHPRTISTQTHSYDIVCMCVCVCVCVWVSGWVCISNKKERHLPS